MRGRTSKVMLAAARELKRDADGKLVPMIALRDLRAQLPLADAAMKACIERSGKRPTGKATLSFTVAAKNNQLVLDTTGVQDDETLSGVPEVLECMHKTAKVLLPDMYPVPELGTAIYVRRQVRIEDRRARRGFASQLLVQPMT